MFENDSNMQRTLKYISYCSENHTLIFADFNGDNHADLFCWNDQVKTGRICLDYHTASTSCDYLEISDWCNVSPSEETIIVVGRFNTDDSTAYERYDVLCYVNRCYIIIEFNSVFIIHHQNTHVEPRNLHITEF